MGKAGRISCVLIPSLLTLAAFLCILFAFLGLRNDKGFLQDIYALRIDTSNFTLPADAPASAKEQVSRLKDWYSIGLWNYCSGMKGDNVAAFCSQRTAYFWFNPLQAMGLQNINDDNILETDAWQKFSDGFKTASRWNFIALAVAFWTCAATFVVGFFAFFSRIGSFVTWIVAGFATFFTVGGAITSTAIYLSLKGIVHERLGQYGVHSTLGRDFFVLVWLASAFIIGGSLFWALSICCCGMGHNSGKKGVKSSRGRTPTWREPSTYQRVPSPYLGAGGHQSVPLTSQRAPLMDERANGYESYRMDV